mmetsp:Transcript_9091/g.19652  ORF Transcript_9091/g.19652 Transcript_9091/m.19652 type:complete len:390 (-) Transcript_9091:347-1516(-)
MKRCRISTLVKLALLLASHTSSTLFLVSSYTFDPMNNSWKPSARQKKQTRQPSSSASPYSQNSYAPHPPEPRPSPGAQFAYNEQDMVRHHYTVFGVGARGEQQNNDPAFVPKASLVEIQYNKKTGEVSLLDEEGVVTPEEYKKIMKAVKYSYEGGSDDLSGTTASDQEFKSQEREEDIAVGTTLYFDPEDLDPTDIIDTEGKDLSVGDDSAAPACTRQEIPVPQYEQRLQDYAQPKLQDQLQPSTEYHQSESASAQAATSAHAETFNSYSIPQPATEIGHTVAQHQTAVAGGYVDAQQPHQYQEYQYTQQPVQTATAVAEPTAELYYQQQQQTGYSNGHQENYEPTMVTEQLTNEQGVEETFDDGTYRKSRGFGFAHRRESFTGTEFEY